MYSARGKSFETGIVPVARYNHPLPRLSIHCPKFVNTNHPIKIKHFHMLHVCTSLNVFNVFVCRLLLHSSLCAIEIPFVIYRL